MGVSGGAVLPPLQAVVHDHVNVNISFVIPLIAFVVVFLYGAIGHRWIIYVDDPIVDTVSFNDETFEGDRLGSEKKAVVTEKENI
jgi:FHS family L-fucose permease-like MFS transporter